MNEIIWEWTVNYKCIQDPAGKGTWTMILNCPGTHNQELHDKESGLSGPSFITCAHCPDQMGKNIYSRDPDGEFIIAMYPERLKCGHEVPRA